MNTLPANLPMPDPNFERNRESFSQEELLKYVGQHVAWSWDGARIVAADPDLAALDKKLIAAEVDLGTVVHDFVDDPNVGWL